jgi:hypothetical protein
MALKNIYIELACRHHINWHTLAHRFTAGESMSCQAFLPDDPPPFFPNDMAHAIYKWNETFNINYFACRAHLKAIAASTWEKALLKPASSHLDVAHLTQALSRGDLDYCLFCDDDDWLAPNFTAILDAIEIKGLLVRWPDLVFDGDLKCRPLPAGAAYSASGALIKDGGHQTACSGLDVRHIDFLFQTNNYAISKQYVLGGHRLEDVVDHIHASQYCLSRRIDVQTMPDTVLSVTNKHPCSATRLSRAMKQYSPDGLRAFVQTYLTKCQAQQIPNQLSWLEPLVNDTIALFSEAIG